MRMVLTLLAFLGAGCAHSSSSAPPAPPAPAAAAASARAIDPRAIVDDADRTEDDRKLDAGRKPAELLRFFGVGPGMKVGEIFAGRGYTTELLARAVGPSGVVYGQNAKVLLERFLEKPWTERLARPVNRNVVRVDRELDDPLPPEARELDLVVSFIVYHDTVWLNADRAKMNAAVLAALKSGGRYVVCDSSAQEGSGVSVAQSLHRIEEKIVRQEVTAAGFDLVEEATFLRNPADTRDWSSSPMTAGERRGTSDRFCLAFRKP